jgi:signal transduction histidine kinase
VVASKSNLSGKAARRRRLTWAFQLFSIATVAGLIAIALVAVRAIAVSHRVATEALGADSHALEEAAELHALLYQKGFVSQYFLTRDSRWLDELRRATPAFEKWLARATSEANTVEAGEAASQLVAEYGRYDAERSRAIAAFQGGEEKQAAQILVENNAHAERLRDLAIHLTDVRRAELAARLRDADRAWIRTLVVLALAVVLAISAAAGVGYLLARRIARPLFELVLRAESAAAGARVEVTAPNDEIGALSQHVTTLAREIESSSAQLAEHRRRLVQAEKMSALGEMATFVAHELLNPLTGVKAALQLLARSRPSAEDIRRTTAEVDAEIRRVEGLARRLVSFARPLQPAVRACSLADVFESVLAATRGEAEERDVLVSFTLNDARKTAADPELLMQVLVNLTVNACQATREGGRVQLVARREGGYTVIDVRDDGPGLAPEIAARLFTPFLTTKPNGHGLGLAISQNIVLAHGGRLEARPNPAARGMTFSVWLPDAGERRASA